MHFLLNICFHYVDLDSPQMELHALGVIHAMHLQLIHHCSCSCVEMHLMSLNGPFELACGRVVARVSCCKCVQSGVSLKRIQACIALVHTYTCPFPSGPCGLST